MQPAVLQRCPLCGGMVHFIGESTVRAWNMKGEGIECPRCRLILIAPSCKSAQVRWNKRIVCEEKESQQM